MVAPFVGTSQTTGVPFCDTSDPAICGVCTCIAHLIICQVLLIGGSWFRLTAVPKELRAFKATDLCRVTGRQAVTKRITAILVIATWNARQTQIPENDCPLHICAQPATALVDDIVWCGRVDGRRRRCRSWRRQRRPFSPRIARIERSHRSSLQSFRVSSVGR